MPYLNLERKKQYETRIKAWNLGKKTTEVEKAVMIEIRRRRMEEEQKETEFVVRGHHIESERLDRYDHAAKRKRKEKTTDLTVGMYYLPCPLDLVPQYFECRQYCMHLPCHDFFLNPTMEVSRSAC